MRDGYASEPPTYVLTVLAKLVAELRVEICLFASGNPIKIPYENEERGQRPEAIEKASQPKVYHDNSEIKRVTSVLEGAVGEEFRWFVLVRW